MASDASSPDVRSGKASQETATEREASSPNDLNGADGAESQRSEHSGQPAAAADDKDGSEGEVNGSGEDNEESESSLFGDAGNDEKDEEEGGEDDDDEPQQLPALGLDDEALGSDDDDGDDEVQPHRIRRSIEDRYDSQDEDVIQVEQRYRVADISLGRHGEPRSTDGEVYLLKLPKFLGVDSVAFSPETFTVPDREHHEFGPPSPGFSAFSVATTTVHWRHSPKNPGEIESDARVLKWSDGSMTLQLANDPQSQFEITSKRIGPNQLETGSSATTNGPGSYNSQVDSHTYITAPHEEAQLLRITNHVTTSLSVLPSAQVHDQALAKLQEAIIAAKTKQSAGAARAVGMITVTEDPELAKKRAETVEKERLKQQKKMQQTMMRDLERQNRTLGRSGLTKTAAGLSVGALEDDETGTAHRTHKQKPGVRPRRGRYSDDDDDDDDDDDGPRGRTRFRQDEYDRTDGFLADSDEEDEDFAEGDENDDDDEVIDLGSEEEAEKPTKSQKRARPAGGASEQADRGTQRTRAKRRRLIIEDDEDE